MQKQGIRGDSEVFTFGSRIYAIILSSDSKFFHSIQSKLEELRNIGACSREPFGTTPSLPKPVSTMKDRCVAFPMACNFTYVRFLPEAVL